VALADGNVRRPITLSKALSTELSEESEKEKLTFSEIVVRHITRAKEGRRQWEARIDEQLAGLGAQLHEVQDLMRTMVDLLEKWMQLQAPKESKPEPEMPIASDEQLYGPIDLSHVGASVPTHEPVIEAPKRRWRFLRGRA
jgi:hypothetical protein